MSLYFYPCFIPYSQRFGLIDGDGNLRCTSDSLEGIIKYKLKVGWGDVVKIKVKENGIDFLGKVDDASSEVEE